MKRLVLLLLALCITSVMFAENFVMIKVKNQQNLQELFTRQELIIHHHNDNFVLASTNVLSDDMILLDENSFANNELYYIVYCTKSEQSEYVNREKNNGVVLYSDDNLLIVKPLNANFKPAKNDGMVAVFDKEARLPQAHRDFPTVTEQDPVVASCIENVSMENLESTVSYLESLENRYYNSEFAYEASDWIAEQFESMNLETEKFEFTYYGNPSSPNVIGIQWGTTYPDEYVVCGSHLDSYSYSGVCPGADDNATGVAAVIETARILTQYEFERSIIYCAFSCEELGLIGSEAYASYCEEMGMNIVGYFNNDMNGYLNPGDEIHIDLIYPDYVAPIGDYYMNVASIYFPEMQVRHVNFQAGDSDHTSFNQHGYMGIYPFEDYQNYSPYIHSANDLIGPSVNSFEMSQRYTQMNLACVSTLAGFAVDAVNEMNMNQFSINPNPANSMLNIKSNMTGEADVNIMDMTGRCVLNVRVNDISNTTINVESLKSGVYFMNINGKIEKLVIE